MTLNRRTHRRWIRAAQWLALPGLAAVTLWNLIRLRYPAAPPLNILRLVPAAGLLLWLAALALPPALARLAVSHRRSFRLTWNTPPEWDDAPFRQALRHLMQLGSGVDILWARDAAGDPGCWLLADDDRLLRRMVRDMLPGGELEEEPYPAPGDGVALLRLREALPAPAELCQRPGIDGLWFRWLGETSALTVLWGAGAVSLARRCARPGDLLPGSGPALPAQPFSGDNPWPTLPPFPPSAGHPGLSSVSLLQRTAPALRINGRGGLLLGRDPAGFPAGFNLPALADLRLLRAFGREAAAQSVSLARQAIRAGLPVAFLDGHGSAAGTLTRGMPREMAAGQILVGDVERPAQSRTRLNPLWLPVTPAHWPAILSDLWPAWLREMGVTPAGLGRDAFFHTRLAVALTGVLAARRGLALEPAALLAALETPDFLARLSDDGGPDIAGPEVWRWWQSEGRQAHNFDVHLRLGHLRERLAALLALPEYGVLWQPPFFNPQEIARRRPALVWRLADPRRRLRPYITSQLMALGSLLAAWPPDAPPLLVVLHELENVESWVARLRRFPAARLVVAARTVTLPVPANEQLLLSRLDRESAGRVAGAVAGIRATDLRRLPEGRLLLRRGEQIGTMNNEQ